MLRSTGLAKTHMERRYFKERTRDDRRLNQPWSVS